MSLIVSDLSKTYGTKTVVDHLSFSMDGPGVYALLGTNGAGKTTTIRMMLNMLARDTGEVLWNGIPLDTDTCNVGYLAEERGLYPKYPLMDQLLYFASIRGVPRAEASKRIRDWSERLELDEYLYPAPARKKGLFSGMSAGKSKAEGNPNADRSLNADEKINAAGKADTDRQRQKAGQKAGKSKLADQLSKGNQQKIQLMVALLSDPELIILDEPMSGLDPVNTDLIRNILREEINKGKYLIMSSHQMATVEEFCTNITILDRSKAVLQGNLNDIKKSRGRVHLHLKTEQDVDAYILAQGITIESKKESEYELKVTGDEQANRLLMALLSDGITVVTFDLREPSLHELFVETVGNAETPSGDMKASSGLNV